MPVFTIWAFPSEHVFEYAQNAHDSSNESAKSHPGISSILTYSLVFNDSLAESEGPDQTARMRRLI